MGRQLIIDVYCDEVATDNEPCPHCNRVMKEIVPGTNYCEPCDYIHFTEEK